MERTASIDLVAWRARRSGNQASIRLFTSIVLACALLSALLASWLPLQFSIVTVFLFAGPHNWFEIRYFLMRLPVRFGKSRNFFLTAFAGIGFLTATYVALPLIYNLQVFSGDAWSISSGLVEHTLAAVGWHSDLAAWQTKDTA